MALEIVSWLQDVSQYLRTSRRRKQLRQPGMGFDYLADKALDPAVVERLHPRRMRLRVAAVVQETPSSKTFRLERVDGPLPPFRAGQYVNVFVDVDGVLTSRPYSIASAPGAACLELTVRDRPGGFVAPFLLHELQVGDELETTGPAGNFYYEPLVDGQALVFLAGGSGITPFMSMLCEALSEGENGGAAAAPLDVTLLYGSRVPEDVIYAAELAQLAARHPNFRFVPVISEPPQGYSGGPTGFLDAQLIRAYAGDPAGKTFYVCGPNVMIDYCLAALAELGVPRHKIRHELYGPPVDVTAEPGWPEDVPADAIFEVQVAGRGTLRARAGEPLMNALERYGIVVPALCRSGACSACRTRLLSGRVYMPAHTALREIDHVHGYIHPCVAYPLEDLQLRL